MPGRGRGEGKDDGQEPKGRDFRLSRAELAGFSAVVAIFLALRAPLFQEPGVGLGWNSDAAIFGLMARAIAAGEGFPLFFWGQSYMGPLTSWLTLFAALLTGGVEPLALRLAASVEVALGASFYWLALRRLCDARVALLTSLCLAIGPRYMVHFTIAPIGAEQMFFLSGIIVWWIARSRLQRSTDWFVFGLLAGFGWWINQGVVFVAGAGLATAVLASAWWRRVRPALRIVDRLTLRAYSLDAAAKTGVMPLQALLLADLGAGILRSFGLEIPALWYWSPVLDPLVLLVVLHLLLTVMHRRDDLVAPPRAQGWWFACGAFIGHLPVVIGWAAGVVPPKYGLSVPALHLGDIVAHAGSVRRDPWLFLGGDTAPLAAAIVAGGFLVAVWNDRRLLAAILRLEPVADARAFPWAAVLLAMLFYLTSQRAHPGAVRYVVSVLPFVAAFAVTQILRIPRGGVAVSAVIAVAYALPAMEQIRGVAAGESERYEAFAGGFDPRPVLAAISLDGYRICYADYWVAYKLEWLASPGVQFVPWRSYDRNPERSQRLNASPERKCFVDFAGRVRPLAAPDLEGPISEEARRRLERQGKSSLASRPAIRN